MKYVIKNPEIPFDLNETGTADQFLECLQSKMPSVHVSMGFDFGTNTMEINTDIEVDPALFDEYGGVVIDA